MMASTIPMIASEIKQRLSQCRKLNKYHILRIKDSILGKKNNRKEPKAVRIREPGNSCSGRPGLSLTPLTYTCHFSSVLCLFIPRYALVVTLGYKCFNGDYILKDFVISL